MQEKRKAKQAGMQEKRKAKQAGKQEKRKAKQVDIWEKRKAKQAGMQEKRKDKQTSKADKTEATRQETASCGTHLVGLTDVALQLHVVGSSEGAGLGPFLQVLDLSPLFLSLKHTHTHTQPIGIMHAEANRTTQAKREKKYVCVRKCVCA